MLTGWPQGKRVRKLSPLFGLYCLYVLHHFRWPPRYSRQLFWYVFSSQVLFHLNNGTSGRLRHFGSFSFTTVVVAGGEVLHPQRVMRGKTRTFISVHYTSSRGRRCHLAPRALSNTGACAMLRSLRRTQRRQMNANSVKDVLYVQQI